MKMDTEGVDLTYRVLPSLDEVQKARSLILPKLPDKGIGLDRIRQHIKYEISPGLNPTGKSANNYAFVIGGSTPAAKMAEVVAVENDEPVSLYLPDRSIAVEVENRALTMICELTGLKADLWTHRTFTTGTTAGHILGLASGREFVIEKAARIKGIEASVAEDGLFEAMRLTDLHEVQVLTTVPHSSLRKAASIVGLGRSCVKDVGRLDHAHRFDMEKLRSMLAKPRVASVVVVSFSEVNAGLFATVGDDMRQIREMCDQCGAWIHVDAAIGMLARALPETPEYAKLVTGARGLEKADSIASDGHKLFNVPWDCGFFLSQHLNIGLKIFQNAGAAYLLRGENSEGPHFPRPLDVGIENSRRFRALSMYATLAAYGREGYLDMLARQIHLSRAIAAYLKASPSYELLPEGQEEDDVFVIVLFRAIDHVINKDLVRRINDSRRICVSGTQWGGEPATRFAVVTWLVNVERDLALIQNVLDEAIKPLSARSA